jgi:O-methyltransferase
MNKPKAFIFGSGTTSKIILPSVEAKYEVIGYLDNNVQCQLGNNVYPPEKLLAEKFDYVIIASFSGLNLIKEQLLNMGIEQGKIITSYVEQQFNSRIVFLENLAKHFQELGIEGNVAEGGVLQGEFAKEINRVFPEKKLYLFDTFEGFSEKDIEIERQNQFSIYGKGYLNITSKDLVLKKLPHPENVIICKGYFPETTKGIEDIFCFVNLDFDLYKPIFAGLEYFYPRMIEGGGVILIHDYFNDGFKGVKQAVQDFEKTLDHSLKLLPIGDGMSICIAV